MNRLARHVAATTLSPGEHALRSGVRGSGRLLLSPGAALTLVWKLLILASLALLVSSCTVVRGDASTGKVFYATLWQHRTFAVEKTSDSLTMIYATESDADAADLLNVARMVQGW